MTLERLMAEDAAARRAALDVQASCIVRAPAGSGKTELLTQRYLALLATVDEPEELIAITFTRKAAAEMRSRIVEALELAAGVEPPGRSHKRLTWQLGKRVNGRDAERGWQLARHPARLRIQTIDSLNSELTRQMPLLAGFGAPPRVNEKPGPLYAEAAQRTLRLLEDGDAAGSAAMATLARHLDNNLPRLQALLAGMLPRRDQWLHPVRAGAPPTRAELEGGLERELHAHLNRLHEALPVDTRQELAELAVLAGRRLHEQGSDSQITCCAELTSLPASGDLAPWRGIAELLLTNEGKWRRTLDRRLGFPPEDAAPKARALELLRRYSGDEALRTLLAAVPKLPASHYEDAPWQALEALLKLLPHAVAELRVVFAERGEVDFAEVALSALRALGEPEAPTDLALALDYRIRHLLVDEFQDTSVNQFRLLEMLSTGWQPGDGRSLFLVGDPAQSIYRFRQAEVGLFLRAWEHGLGALPLKRLTLAANFRSRAPLVDWYNRSFPGVFPARAEVAGGAVPYAPSAACRPAGQGTAVAVHPLSGEVRGQEAELVCRLVETAQREGEAKVAVLVRARSHLAAIVRSLKRAGLRFQAVEIESLRDQPVVQDLLALTRALNHPADRTAWLAVLRAPWCGMTLAELHRLAAHERETPIAVLMEADAAHAEMNPRYARTRRVLLGALAERRRGSLREQVERTWLRLGGPAALKDAEALADAEAYLELLEELDQGGTLPGVDELERRLAELFALPDPEADGSLQLMTIHKAKGLEFDVVILPGLDAGTRRGEDELLVWLERPREAGEADLLLAPLHATGNEKDPVYSWISALQRDQERLEIVRLLYVAATRARERLHLIGGAEVRERDGAPAIAAPKSGSLLSFLWPAV
ncbi:MAG TPA: UvrD-helicase domain-containing protein, partial [Gammaproteobacteria bacterium]|nr:UvrD-helicase domain-containing protein [Gammaproteobacteria bacterium]